MEFVATYAGSVPPQTKDQRWQHLCTKIPTIKPHIKIKNTSLDNYITKLCLKEYDLLQQKYTSQSILVCPQCKSNNVTYVSKQIRRADESETYFCKCLACKKQWTFS